MLQRKKLLFLSIFLLFIAIETTYSITYKVSNHVNQNSPVYDDFYVAGGQVHINAKIKGDLLIAGGKVSVNDTISEDLTILGGEITVNAYIGDDIRVAGGTVQILHPVGGDIIIFAGDISFDQNVIVYGDVTIYGGNVNLNGIILGRLVVKAGNITQNGRLEGSANITGGEITINGSISGKAQLVANHIGLSEDAQFYDDVEYWQTDGEINFEKKLIKGKSVFNPALKIEDKKLIKSNWVFGWFSLSIFSFLASVFLIILFHFLFRNLLVSSATLIDKETMKCFGYGILFFIVSPIIGLILILTIAGIPIGLLLFSLYGFCVLFSYPFVSVSLSHFINIKYLKNWNDLLLIVVSGFILLLLFFISIIPFVGWLFLLILVCICYGATLLKIGFSKSVK